MAPKSKIVAQNNEIVFPSVTENFLILGAPFPIDNQ